MPQWSAAAWGCCYWEASCAGAWGNFSEKSLETAWGKPISLLSWTSRAATGFPARISQDPHSARGLGSADYPLQVQLRCPGLLSAEPFSRSTLYSWQQSRATWFPGLLPVIASLRVRGNVRRSRSDPAAVSSFGRLPQSLGGDGAGCRGGERSPPRKPVRRHPSSADPLPKITEELARQRNMEGRRLHQHGFVSATKQPAKLLELMRRSCCSDFCLCT